MDREEGTDEIVNFSFAHEFNQRAFGLIIKSLSLDVQRLLFLDGLVFLLFRSVQRFIRWRLGHNTTQELVWIMESRLSGRQLLRDLVGDLLLTEKGVRLPDDGKTPSMDESSNKMSNELGTVVGSGFNR